MNIDNSIVAKAVDIAGKSPLIHHSWIRRGVAPHGYIKGMVVVYAKVLARLKTEDPIAIEMARPLSAGAGPIHRDALNWYAVQFKNVGMKNEGQREILRHLFVLLMGLGMRESSGQYNEGRDTSAHNRSSDTAESGLFQMSWDAHMASPYIPRLMEEYNEPGTEGHLDVFKEGVAIRHTGECGSGQGYAYQKLAKAKPAFAVEAAAVGLRNIRTHWGPINQHAAEVLPAADQLFLAIDSVV